MQRNKRSTTKANGFVEIRHARLRSTAGSRKHCMKNVVRIVS